jgi:hypothetical protein
MIARLAVFLLMTQPQTFARCMQVGRYFKVKERRSTLTTELRSGLVTFLTMAVRCMPTLS